jgi:hypothetical protein
VRKTAVASRDRTQIGSFNAPELQRLWRGAAGNDRSYEREILVALQPIGGKADVWKALADQISASPPGWRWWIRRHPASTSAQDEVCAPLLSMRRTNIVAGDAAQIPLPALLGHADAVVSLASGAAAEAEILGVRAFFLDHEALDTFPGLIARGSAQLIQVQSLQEAIGGLPEQLSRNRIEFRQIAETIHEIDRLAADYSRLCTEPASDEIHGSERVGRQREEPCAA